MVPHLGLIRTVLNFLQLGVYIIAEHQPHREASLPTEYGQLDVCFHSDKWRRLARPNSPQPEMKSQIAEGTGTVTGDMSNV